LPLPADDQASTLTHKHTPVILILDCDDLASMVEEEAADAADAPDEEERFKLTGHSQDI
jgi:hypothetical protein